MTRYTYNNVAASYTYGVYGELLSGDTTLTHFRYNCRCGVSTEANGLYYMRQRYYNPQIKRFINRDILTGSLDNSQSLNRYSYVQGNPVSYTDPFGLSPVNGLFTNSNFAHSILSLASCIPGFVGTAASVLDGLVYAVVDKDYSMTALCFMDALSFGLGKAGTNLLKANKLSNTAQVLITSSHLMSNAASFGMCANATMTTGFAMYDKYYIQGQSIDSNTKWEVLSLGMSVLGGVILGKGISKSTKKMSSMLQQDGFTNALKGEVLEMASGIKRSVSAIMADNRGFVDLDELASLVRGGKSGKKTYQTYTKTHPVTGEVYSGRTSGTGTPAENVRKRDANHHMNAKGFGPAVLDKTSDNYNAIRGREQMLIDYHGGAKSVGGSSGNAIMGIGPNNKQGDTYINAAKGEFGEIE